VNHFKKNIISAVKKSKLIIISQTGTTGDNDLCMISKTSKHKFTIPLMISAAIYPKTIIIEPISVCGKFGRTLIMMVIKKQRLQMNATLAKKRILFIKKILHQNYPRIF